jgi:hypothetical protein
VRQKLVEKDVEDIEEFEIPYNVPREGSLRTSFVRKRALEIGQ